MNYYGLGETRQSYSPDQEQKLRTTYIEREQKKALYQKYIEEHYIPQTTTEEPFDLNSQNVRESTYFEIPDKSNYYKSAMEQVMRKRALEQLKALNITTQNYTQLKRLLLKLGKHKINQETLNTISYSILLNKNATSKQEEITKEIGQHKIEFIVNLINKIINSESYTTLIKDILMSMKNIATEIDEAILKSKMLGGKWKSLKSEIENFTNTYINNNKIDLINQSENIKSFTYEDLEKLNERCCAFRCEALQDKAPQLVIAGIGKEYDDLSKRIEPHKNNKGIIKSQDANLYQDIIYHMLTTYQIHQFFNEKLPELQELTKQAIQLFSDVYFAK